MSEQGTTQWFQDRWGRVTASRVADVVAKTKSGYSASRDNYMAQLVCERMTGTPAESFSNAAMAWGTEQEPFARAAYEAKKDVLVDQVGFIHHPSIDGAGASPDGMVGDDGLIEIKCPLTKTHLKWVMADKPAQEYVNQMMWQMACTGRSYVDFVSYDPRLPVDLELFVARLERDEEYIQLITDEVIKFDNEVTQLVNKLKELRNV
mgnify:CR=1 FL=1